MKSLTKNNVYKQLEKPKTLDEMRDFIGTLETDYEPRVVMEKAALALSAANAKSRASDAGNSVFGAMTLSEFENGTMLTTTVPEECRTFGIDMLRQLQKDYGCTLISERATAELVALSYIGIIVAQRRLDFYLEKTELNKAELAFIAILSKEHDRATRQYLSALQTLRMLKVPPFQLNIKTGTAIIGQNQIIQENKND